MKNPVILYKNTLTKWLLMATLLFGSFTFFINATATEQTATKTELVIAETRQPVKRIATYRQLRQHANLHLQASNTNNRPQKALLLYNKQIMVKLRSLSSSVKIKPIRYLRPLKTTPQHPGEDSFEPLVG